MCVAARYERGRACDGVMPTSVDASGWFVGVRMVPETATLRASGSDRPHTQPGMSVGHWRGMSVIAYPLSSTGTARIT
jgi:hypothetical protein